MEHNFVAVVDGLVKHERNKIESPYKMANCILIDIIGITIFRLTLAIRTIVFED